MRALLELEEFHLKWLLLRGMALGWDESRVLREVIVEAMRREEVDGDMEEIAFQTPQEASHSSSQLGS